MTSNSSIKAWVFDAYGTVFDVHSVARRADAMFPGKGQELSRLWRAKQIEYMFLRSLMKRYVPHDQNTQAALVYCCKTLGLPCTPQQRDELMQAYLQLSPFPEAPPALARLEGKTRAILSVGTPPMLEAMVGHAGLAASFEHLLSVDSVKTYKPSPQVYQLVLDSLGVTRDEVGFVTSNYFDVAGAKAFGFKVFWINRGGAVPDELDLLPDVELDSLAGLPAG
jgi:2-haloacid dehalogenase